MGRNAILIALAAASTLSSQPMPGTAPLERTGDLAAQMVEGIDRYLMRRLAEVSGRRAAKAAADSAALRERLRTIAGAADKRVPFDAPALDATLRRPALVASSPAYQVYAIRWPVFDGVDGEGLLLEPRGPLRGRVVALPDADWTPEMLCGLASGVPAGSQFARRLAESGFLVVVPVLINREDAYSGKEGVRFTNQPHREFIYRMAYEMGRHIIGYEVQKVQALVDWFAGAEPRLPIGVAGYGEGGLLALYSAALDERIDGALISGYFGPREQVWREPIYRNLWGQLESFGDAELAGLIAPRPLVIEASPHPEVAGPPPEREGRRGAAPGAIRTPSPESVRREFERARDLYGRRHGGGRIHLVEGPAGSEPALRLFVRALDAGAALAPNQPAPQDQRAGFDPAARQKRQFLQLVDFTQRLVRQSEFTRREFFANADARSLESWQRTTEPYRRIFWEEVIGKMPPPSEPLAAATRRAYDTAAFTGYEVVLPVWPEVFAYGVLLVPKDLRPGERRPVVVCQHGLEGRPQDLIAPADRRTEQVYGRFAARLAERGFVVYAPQNPYIGQEKFRVLLRKAHPLGLSLFSFIIGQHQRTLEWLATLPFADASRIGFYGLSYGGKTAMRVPAVLPGYALSICSADFNEWIWKITDIDHPFSYMYTGEYDMLEFNLGNTFNYAEMAALIAPRPFMVERGHRDGVSIDEWVAYEYARVRRLYADLKIPERTRIEFFDGPHQIHGVGTFEFLERHLGPARGAR
jgi:dienelactone hydrolase